MRSDDELALGCHRATPRGRRRQPPGAALALRTELVRDLSPWPAGTTEREDAVVDAHRGGARSARVTSSPRPATPTWSTSTSSSAGFRAADSLLEASLPFTVERDIPICHHWQTGMRSRLRFVQGRWSAAVEDADQGARRGGMPMARLWPHLVAGLVPLRRGDGRSAPTTSSAPGSWPAAWTSRCAGSPCSRRWRSGCG